jgi:hypothetical protein
VNDSKEITQTYETMMIQDSLPEDNISHSHSYGKDLQSSSGDDSSEEHGLSSL